MCLTYACVHSTTKTYLLHTLSSTIKASLLPCMNTATGLVHMYVCVHMCVRRVTCMIACILQQMSHASRVTHLLSHCCNTLQHTATHVCLRAFYNKGISLTHICTYSFKTTKASLTHIFSENARATRTNETCHT